MGEAIRVALAGYGRLGSELARGLVRAPDTDLVGVVRRSRSGDGLTIEGSAVQVTDDLPALLDRARPRVLVEASLASGIEVRGLMTIPPIPESPGDSRHYFTELRRLRDSIARTHPGVTELSMGMSDDYEVAIEEGASIIRLGRAIFGARS